MNSIFRFFYLSTVMIFLACQSKSQDGEPKNYNLINKNEIAWNPSIEDALAQAKAQGKMLFVECFSPTCPVCLSLEPLFKTPAVAAKYNSNFINYKLDVGNADQVKFLTENNIYLPSWPQFLFFDSNGNIQHQHEPSPTAESLISGATQAQNISKRASSFKERFAKGEKSIDFLIATASYGRLTKDTTLSLAAADKLFEIYPKDQLSSETSWKIAKKVISDMDNGFAKHWIERTSIAEVFEKKEGHSLENVNNIFTTAIQFTLYGPKGRTYSTTDLAKVRKYMALTGASQYTETALWEFDTKANIKEGKLTEALAIGDKMAAKFASNGPSLIYITRVFNDNFTNASYTKKAKIWLSKAKILVKEDIYLAEYFYESSRLNKRIGNISLAKAEAQQAITAAQKGGVINLKKFIELLETL